ncbi:MAG: SDR family oxidoreductase [Alphaproteobacteria bacterium]|nr:SDR family oxidoreductase [Alphaproteobacteria bacterium]
MITGAAGSIGSATALALAAGGARLALADTAPLAGVEAETRAAGAEVLGITADVGDTGAVQAMVAATLAAYGRVDILATVAGITSQGTAADLPEAEWDRVIRINLKGTFLCCQAVIAPMRRQGYGRIVTIGSVLGKNGGNPRPWIDPSEQQRAGNVAYGVTKAGVHAMTAYLAKELAADGITVNAVAPGPVTSALTTKFPDSLRRLIPVGRMGTTADVARAITFLADDDAGFITGEVIDVNGGLWMD